MATNTLGSFERITLPEFDLVNVVAKVDTGAYSGALHCTSTRVMINENGEKVLRFVLPEKLERHFETTQFVRRHVRSASGHRQARYIIETTIIIDGRSYPIKIGLSDRSKMKRIVLIGRRFLRENKMLVDVCINQDLDDEEGEFGQ
jgi:hypothetical protein